MITANRKGAEDEMKMEKYILWQDGEYFYPMAFGFVPHMTGYIHEENGENRPCMIVVPGGGYSVVSPTEAEIVAKKFYEYGYQTFVVTYTTNLLMKEPLKNQPMKDLGRAVRFVRKHAKELYVRPDQIVLCGFSAGAHLCGSVCVHYDEIQDQNPDYAEFSPRPDAAVLSYPVITSGEKAHEGSFRALLGDAPSQEEKTYYSLERQLERDMPPCFLWQTATDEEVPVENSALFVQALKDKGIPFAYHIFSEGPHGMSLADDDWVHGRFGEPYTMEQTFRAMQAIEGGTVEVEEEVKKMLFSFQNMQSMELPINEVDPEVSVWPEMVVRWLLKTCGIKTGV